MPMLSRRAHRFLKFSFCLLSRFALSFFSRAILCEYLVDIEWPPAYLGKLSFNLIEVLSIVVVISHTIRKICGEHSPRALTQPHRHQHRECVQWLLPLRPHTMVHCAFRGVARG